MPHIEPGLADYFAASMAAEPEPEWESYYIENTSFRTDPRLHQGALVAYMPGHAPQGFIIRHDETLEVVDMDAFFAGVRSAPPSTQFQSGKDTPDA